MVTPGAADINEPIVAIVCMGKLVAIAFSFTNQLQFRKQFQSFQKSKRRRVTTAGWGDVGMGSDRDTGHTL